MELRVVLTLSMALLGSAASSTPQRSWSRSPGNLRKSLLRTSKEQQRSLFSDQTTLVQQQTTTFYQQGEGDDFSCQRRAQGFYTDPSSDCTKFHVCMHNRVSSSVTRTTSLCPAGKRFNPNTLQCDWWDNVTCEDAFIPEEEIPNNSVDHPSPRSISWRPRDNSYNDLLRARPTFELSSPHEYTPLTLFLPERTPLSCFTCCRRKNNYPYPSHQWTTTTQRPPSSWAVTYPTYPPTTERPHFWYPATTTTKRPWYPSTWVVTFKPPTTTPYDDEVEIIDARNKEDECQDDIK